MNIPAVVAVLSFFLNVLLTVYAVKTFISERKIARKNLESRFFEEVFMKRIIYDIPQRIIEVEFVDSKLTDNYQKLVEELNMLLKASYFYKYFHSEFYEKLKDKIFEIDDYFINSSQKNIPKERQDTVEKEIASLFDELYRIFKNEFSEI